MGDISELRGIITIGSFLGVLVLLMVWIPTPFLVAEYGGRSLQTPEYFEAIALEKYAVIFNETLDGTHPYANGMFHFLSEELGGPIIHFYYRPANVTYEVMFRMTHVDMWWIFMTGEHSMNFYWQGVDVGTYLSDTTVNLAYSQGDLSFVVSCNHVELDLMFAFNETAYSSPTEALDHYDLYMLIGVEWDQVSTSMSAWDIIGMLLFFQLPNVHWMLNAIIAIPIWLGIAYLSFIMILRAIGAIFGGGA